MSSEQKCPYLVAYRLLQKKDRIPKVCWPEKSLKLFIANPTEEQYRFFGYTDEIIEDEKPEINENQYLEEYYEQTFKDVNKFMYKLSSLSKKEFEEINIIGHSVAGIDLPYFKTLDMLTNQKLIWNIYYHELEEEQKMQQALIEIGICKNRIKMHPDTDFYIQ